MGIYKLPKIIRKNDKPSFGAKINWHHPLSQGLVMTLLFNEGGGKKVFNAAKRFPGYYGDLITLATTSVTWQNTIQTGLKFNSAEGIYSPFVKVGIWPGYPVISIVASITYIDNAAVQQILVSDTTNDVTRRNFQFRIGVADQLMFVTFVGGAPKIITGSTTLSNNTTYNIAGVSDGTNISIYLNGKSDATPIAGGIIDSAQLGNVGIGANPDKSDWSRVSETSNSYIHYIYLFNRSLSAAEINSLHANPYQMFWHPVKDIYIIPIAAPPPTGGKSIFGYDSIFHAGGIIQT